MTTLRKRVIQIAEPPKGYIGSERIQSTGYGVPQIDDAYLFNGEPTNKLTLTGQLVPNFNPLERAGEASALAKRYPYPTNFKGLQSYGNAIKNSPRVSNPTNWRKGQY